MFVGFQGMSFGDDAEILNPFIQQLEKGELTLEEILEEDEIIKDIRSNNDSKFINFFTSEKIKKLIDYSTKIPSKDEHNIGYKFPFNATEILCSECQNFQAKLMTEKILNRGGNNKKVNKNGFIFQLFKKINSIKNEIVKTIKMMMKQKIKKKRKKIVILTLTRRKKVKIKITLMKMIKIKL